MSTRLLAPGLALLVACEGAGDGAVGERLRPASDALQAEGIAAIRRQHDEAVAILTRLPRDDGAWVQAHYTADAVLLPPNVAPVRGHDAILAWYRQLPQLNRYAVTYTDVQGAGDLAYSHGTWERVLADPAGSPSSADAGTYLEVFRHEPDGGWRVAYEMFHSGVGVGAPIPVGTENAPPPTGNAAPPGGSTLPGGEPPAPGTPPIQPGPGGPPSGAPAPGSPTPPPGPEGVPEGAPAPGTMR